MRKQLAGVLAAGLFWALPLAAQDNNELFNKLDANKDGYVTGDEVPEPQKGLFDRLLRNADKDGDKKLSKDEFQAGLRPDDSPRPPLGGGAGFPGRPGNAGKAGAPRQDPRQAEAMFTMADKNNDGKLTKDEVQEDKREGFEQMVQRINPGGDHLNREQFVRGMMFYAQAGGAPPQGGQPRPGAGDRAQLEARRAEERFAAADKNNDGKLSKDEMAGQEREAFNQMLERFNPGGDSLNREQYARGWMFLAGMAQPPAGQPRPGQPPRPGGGMDRGQLEELFDRTDSNSDGKITKDEIPEERQGMRMVLEQSGGDSLTKEQFLRGMTGMFPQAFGQRRPDGAPERRPDGNQPERRPDGFRPGGPPPGAGLFAALDTDRDGQLSNNEIVGAGTALLRLDRNSDGRITPDEAFGPGGPPPFGRPGNGPPGDRPPGDARPNDRRPGDRPPGDRPPGEARPNDRSPGDRPPGDRPPGDRRPGDAGKVRPQRGKGPPIGNPEEFRERLKQADTNGDGKLSKEEAPPMLKQRFEELDANKDGFLDESETRRLYSRPRGGSPPGTPPSDNK